MKAFIASLQLEDGKPIIGVLGQAVPDLRGKSKSTIEAAEIRKGWYPRSLEASDLVNPQNRYPKATRLRESSFHILKEVWVAGKINKSNGIFFGSGGCR
jgi:hypothetical protein